MQRREFLAAAAAASAVAAPEPQFRHRGYLGWITDLATHPDESAAWPSMRLDERLLQDYRDTFAMMRSTGYNEISVWGLYVSRAWPVDVESAVAKERGAMVEKLIASAHDHGIKVLSGLGVYSWGFDEILKANPRLQKGNPRAMCASEDASWKWMQRVIDFVYSRFPIDGISMQSADQGRCPCTQCSRYSHAEYHALLNVRVSEYVRAKWPRKTIGVNSWGLRFEEPETLESIEKMSGKVDYLIDVHDSSRRRDAAYRRKIISSLKCDFGTLGGPQVEPPQHWARDRWFLPTLRRVGVHLDGLAREGGRACEFFYHILANPGDEVSFRLAGKMLSNPAAGWQKHLDAALEEAFEAPIRSVRAELASLFLRAEDAYFQHLPPGTCGTMSMEPLVSSEPGPPVYLTKRLKPEQRRQYGADLAAVFQGFAKLKDAVGRKDKIARVMRSIENVRKDAAG